MTGGAAAADRAGPGAGSGREGPSSRELAAFVRDLLGSGRPRVEPAGPEGEIAVVRVPRALVADLLAEETRSRVAGEARRLGFRHAALDLALDADAPSPEPGPAGPGA